MKAPLSTPYIVKTKFKYTASSEKTPSPAFHAVPECVRGAAGTWLASSLTIGTIPPTAAIGPLEPRGRLPCVHAVKRATALSVCLCADTPQHIKCVADAECSS